ncbi:unnamed protein product [Paramecium sonneborni]|uniref:Uncharacterized protein n=1 Tax=Paramecium sonneborni TaxID=65129 RepID=A0A8S1MVD8_9CILI|nr:unnamed protein product [Paramecium sonneborni]
MKCIEFLIYKHYNFGNKQHNIQNNQWIKLSIVCTFNHIICKFILQDNIHFHKMSNSCFLMHCNQCMVISKYLFQQDQQLDSEVHFKQGLTQFVQVDPFKQQKFTQDQQLVEVPEHDVHVLSQPWHQLSVLLQQQPFSQLRYQITCTYFVFINYIPRFATQTFPCSISTCYTMLIALISNSARCTSSCLVNTSFAVCRT